MGKDVDKPHRPAANFAIQPNYNLWHIHASTPWVVTTLDLPRFRGVLSVCDQAHRSDGIMSSSFEAG
jgi:hypothetical protein